MMRYFLRRLFLMIPTLLGVLLLTFIIIQFTPGDPVLQMLGTSATPERVEEVRELMGLNDPMPIQYMRYVLDAVRGDLGESIRGGTPVTQSILDRLPPTLELALMSVLFSSVIGISLGVFSALTRYRWLDRLTLVLSIVGISVPNFWIGIILIIVFGVQLGWISVVGSRGLGNLILPAFTLALPQIAILIRLTRATILDESQQDYVRTARAKGLSTRTVNRRHLLRNALIPVITVLGLDFGAMLGGAVIIESVFARPGLGTFAISAVNARDYPQIQGTVVFLATVYVLVNVLVDLLYGLLDPRIRY